MNKETTCPPQLDASATTARPRRFRLRAWAVALAFGALAWTAAGRAQEVEALDFTSLGSGFDYEQGTFSIGWRFGTNEDVTVSALGTYDDLMNGISAPRPVGIYDANTQKLLVSATVQPSDPLTGFFRYKQITPVVLPGGHDYYIVTVNGTTKESDNYAVGVTDIDVDPSITFEGFAAYGGDGGPEAFTLKRPTNYSANTFHGDFGPSFKLQTAPVGPTGDPSALTFKAVTSKATGNLDVGWQFTPKKDIKIYRVGYYQAKGGTFSQSHPISVWDAVTKEVVVPEVLVSNDDPVDGFFRYHAFAQTTLLANHPYFIMGVSGSDPYVTAADQLNVNPLLTYQGAVYNSDTTQTVPAFPDVIDGGSGLFGPSFQILNTTGQYVIVTINKTNLSRKAKQTATITLTRSGVTDLSKPVVIRYTLGGPLQRGADYKLKGAQKIAAGKNSATLEITPIEGGANGNLTFTVEPTTDYDPSTPATVTVTIKR